MERFWEKVDKSNNCWTWTASKNRGGYGQFKIDGKLKSAHRVAYELEIGKIPDGLVIDHLCRNRACVNPQHLDPVTSKINSLRGTNHNAIKTHCPAGHEYNEINTRITPNGKRKCRVCHKMSEGRRRIEESNRKALSSEQEI
jgi:aspartate carbamoyltransferase regulatory subunit